jgi:hypothetical protein
MITNDEISMERKHQNLRMVENLACKFANTNWQDAIFREESDRRWYPIKSPIQTREQRDNLTATGHFKRLAKLFKNGGALRQFLLDWKIADDFPTDGPAPDSSFRKEMILEGKNGLEEQIEEVIEDEKVPTVAADLIFLPHLITKLTDTRNNHKPSHYLRAMQFAPYKPGSKFTIGEQRGTVWIHEEKFDKTLDPLVVLKERNDIEVDLD